MSQCSLGSQHVHTAWPCRSSRSDCLLSESTKRRDRLRARVHIQQIVRGVFPGVGRVEFLGQRGAWVEVDAQYVEAGGSPSGNADMR